MEIPDQAIELLSIEGFCKHYTLFLASSKTNVEAYEKCEILHQKFFGRTKYASYDSFRRIYYRKRKKSVRV